MSESAEVKLTTEYLNSELEGKILRNWCFISGQYENDLPCGFKKFKDCLPLMIENVLCKGKIIYFILFGENIRYYIIHNLRMSGKWLEFPDENSRWYIETDNKKIWFSDSKCFATLYFTHKEENLRAILNRLGPDILTDNFTLDIWKKLLSEYPNKNITEFIMNQNIISGCGNYIKSEALFYAKISPFREVKSLTEQEVEKLYEGLRIIPRLSYVHKGLSTDAYGKQGFFGNQLNIYLNRKANCSQTPDGRTTFWDPSVQK